MSTALTDPRPGPADWQVEFMERLATLSEVSGLPPSHVRVFAWMIVCDPPEQSVDDLRRALGLSAGAISMATSMLIRIGIVERISRPGERRLLYRFHARGWERLLRLRLESMAQMRRAGEDALENAPGQDRLSGMCELFVHYERSTAELLEDPSIVALPRRPRR
jgi:DNA-binding MarR family transcriptional regulator